MFPEVWTQNPQMHAVQQCPRGAGRQGPLPQRGCLACECPTRRSPNRPSSVKGRCLWY